MIFLVVILLFIYSCSTIDKAVPSSASTTILSSFEVVSNLNLEITETSGLETYNGHLLTHNDSDAKPVIYFLDTNGIIKSQIEYREMTNIDWEDIAISDTDLYIADIGNNYGDRKDLKIYKIPISEIQNPAVQPEILALEYDGQQSFTRQNQRHSFDGEAIVYAKDRLLLFSKDWINFNTDVYAIEPIKEKQNVTSLQNLDVNGLVTGATFNGSNRVVLCGYNSSLNPFIAILKLENGTLQIVQRITLPVKNGAQIEAITYFETIGNDEVYYLSSEAVNLKLGEDEAKTNGQLYKMTLKIE
ncbi:hypothetical protein BST86_10390 [Nonlabens agnitus]|uniref:Gll0560 protein n=2 Tax=Nonlabens agnitus TaxID=870484 RepID=A0A2S9WVH2_9FLAO|nr:hypothetical protein BST86_10390 [Nonlabens agnitus]